MRVGKEEGKLLALRNIIQEVEIRCGMKVGLRASYADLRPEQGASATAVHRAGV